MEITFTLIYVDLPGQRTVMAHLVSGPTRFQYYQYGNKLEVQGRALEFDKDPRDLLSCPHTHMLSLCLILGMAEYPVPCAVL